MAGLSNSYAEMMKAVQNKTPQENTAQGLADATKDIPQNTFGGGFLKGAAIGNQIAANRKGDDKRDKIMDALMEKQQAALAQEEEADKMARKIQSMKGADEILTLNGDVLANHLQTLDLGDEKPLYSFVQANQDIANLLGDDGPGGSSLDGIGVTTQNGVKYLQAYGRDPEGKQWQGQPISMDGLLQRYNPDTLKARAAAALATKNAELENAKLTAEVGKVNAEAGKLNRAATGDVEKKPLSPTAIKIQNEAVQDVGMLSNINTDLAALVGQIDSGDLNLGPVDNMLNKGRNAVGMSNTQSRNLATLDATLEKLRNDSLRLNAGVQTDGDAQRAWNEIMSNKNDTALVKQRLQELQKINERGANLKRLSVDQLRSEYGQQPLDFSKFQTGTTALNESPAPDSPQTATKFAVNPKTGQRLMLQGGQWVSAQ